MPKPYSDDLRERVIEAVVAGASRREAAESFSLSASSAVRWLQRWHDTGNARAKLSGGSTSPLEGHVEWLLALAEQPDLILDEIVVAMRKQRIPGSRTAVWRFSSDIMFLAPTLDHRDVVIMDNLPAHKVAGVTDAIEAVGATAFYLLPYSPDLNPIEQVSANSKRSSERPPSAPFRHSGAEFARSCEL
jgi:transposase